MDVPIVFKLVKWRRAMEIEDSSSQKAWLAALQMIYVVCPLPSLTRTGHQGHMPCFYLSRDLGSMKQELHSGLAGRNKLGHQVVMSAHKSRREFPIFYDQLSPKVMVIFSLMLLSKNSTKVTSTVHLSQKNISEQWWERLRAKGAVCWFIYPSLLLWQTEWEQHRLDLQFAALVVCPPVFLLNQSAIQWADFFNPLVKETMTLRETRCLPQCPGHLRPQKTTLEFVLVCFSSSQELYCLSHKHSKKEKSSFQIPSVPYHPGAFCVSLNHELWQGSESGEWGENTEPQPFCLFVLEGPHLLTSCSLLDRLRSTKEIINMVSNICK